jgi:hypothetical protein
MTDFALRPPRLRARARHGSSVSAAFVILASPDCCLNDRHVAGSEMEAFAFVCHGAR